MAKEKKPFWERKIPKLLKNVAGNTLQIPPVIGTIVTAFKEDKEGNPAGTLKLSGWHIYRLVIGLVLGYLVFKNVDVDGIWKTIEPIINGIS